MSTTAMSTAGPDDAPAIPFRSHRRTVTETDIVSFVSLIRHRIINQRGEELADFTETVCFLPKTPA